MFKEIPGGHLEVRKVTKIESRELKGKWGIRIGNFGSEHAVRNTSAQMANALTGSEMDKITAAVLRDVGNSITSKKKN